ncbi:MAG TPA: hypothetical protein VH701_18025 [Vicinamibacterales bacterium]|jgi:hypothetical protein
MTVLTGGRALSVAVLAALAIAGCSSLVEIPIETPIQAKLDISAFSRVLVAGFVAGGSDAVDANLETVRLLRSQLRSKSSLRVIDADPMSLLELAKEEAPGSVPDPTPPPNPPSAPDQAAPADNSEIKNEKDLEAYEHLFANVDFWKRIGEEFQNPLIVTGTVLFAPQQRSQFVQREQEVYDAFGRRSVVPVRTFMERKGFILAQKFIFIDGRSGATITSEQFREERLYNQNQNTPALSSYFELMDAVVPKFLNILSTQKVRGTRVLLQ